MDTFIQNLRTTGIFIDRFEGTDSGDTAGGTPKAEAEPSTNLPTQIGNRHLLTF